MSAVNLTCIIDDDEIFVYAMKKLIGIKQLSKETISFQNVFEAIEYLKNNQDQTTALPDVLFLDINLPIHDGWDFINEYQKIEEMLVKKPRIYMLSSSIDTSDRQKAKSLLSITDFFEKPISQENLKIAFGQ